MKKTALVLGLLSVMGFAQQATAAPGDSAGTAQFQWAGTVPAVTDGATGYFIVNSDGTELLTASNGTMSFENKDGDINLVNSQSFGFKVVTDATVDGGAFDPATDNASIPFNAQLISLKAGPEGFVVDQNIADSYFGVTLNDTELTAANTTVAENTVANVKVAKRTGFTGATIPTAEAGQVWQVMAAVALTDATTIL
jgi:hypothetical protein